MTDGPARVWFEWLRWGALGVAVVVLTIFLVVQGRATIDVSYGQSPSSADPVPEGEAGELSDATVPSVEEMTRMVADNQIVRLPGSIAHIDEDRVRAEIGGTDARILIAPPGLDEDERERVREVENATVRVLGTEVSGGLYQAVPDDFDGWRKRFATGDVTGSVTLLLRELRGERTEDDEDGEDDTIAWREPTAEEFGPVAADLRETGLHTAEGSTMDALPEAAATAFPDGDALYAVFPQQEADQPVPDYTTALAAEFPDRPIVVMYGSWVEYRGPYEEDFASVVTASIYGQLNDRLSKYDYPQSNVLHAYLNRVTDVRYAGLFDRPLPYQPFDPLRVTMPALPWIFAACVLVFLALSVRAVLRPVTRPRQFQQGHTAARLAGLTALAIEVSALTGRDGDTPLTRGLAALEGARKALNDKLPDQHVHTLLNQAEAELDDTARAVGRTDYRPNVYLQGRLA
ncbi:hypothetical protein [Actinoalloteichus spitiensis]|uniref:hypothetical protein n=1 Tax=Actinoalloteichus spitiensis TaxID=252394 RepID=UPI00068E8184|nr:hypothetical protein [Actinoalloteichus spitiensis]